MATHFARNWGYGFLLSIVLAAGMLVKSYGDYSEAQSMCLDCIVHQYDFIKNEVLPTILFWLGGILASWVVHRFVTPALIQQKFGISATLATFLAVLLILAAATAYGYLNIDLFRNDYQEGPQVFSYFGPVHMVQDSLRLLLVIMAYEIVVETYVFLNNSAQKNRSIVLKAVSELLLGFCLLTLLWYIGTLARNVIYEDPECNKCDRLNLLWYWIVPVIVLHLHWFYRCIPIINKGVTEENRLNFLELLVVPALIVLYLFIEFEDSSYKVWAVSFLVVHVLGIGSAYLRSLLVSEKRNFLTEISQTSAELSALRAQINPHFLFNALNTLYAIAMQEHSEKTADGIQKLGDMMRFMLQENHQNRIPLAKEIEYLHNLISIQKMRLDENQQIELKINLQNPERDIYIAPMLLNPLVENAFKHGISFRNPSWIYITLTHDPERIFFKVHNSYHTKNEIDPEKDSHGIGLDNVRKRLDLLYPEKYELSIQVSEHDYFVSLILTIV